MPTRIYIETSIVSYLTSRPSKDLIRSACQQITKEWWERGRLTAMPYSSPYVVEEAGAGDPQAASKRLNALREIPLLPVTREIPALASSFCWAAACLPKQGLMPCTAYHQMDVLLTWNCTHIANPAQLPEGYKLPELVTF